MKMLGKNCLVLFLFVAFCIRAFAMENAPVRHPVSDQAPVLSLAETEEKAVQEQLKKVRTQISVLMQTKQLKELQSRLEELQKEGADKKNTSPNLSQKTVKMMANLLDRVETYLSIGVPILGIVVFVNIYRTIQGFFGNGVMKAPALQYPTKFKCDQNECVPVFDSARHGCRSWWPFSLLDPHC